MKKTENTFSFNGLTFGLLFFIAFSFCGLTGCYDDGGAFVPDTPKGDITIFQNQLQNKSISINFNHATGTIIHTDAETIITIPPFAFSNAGNNIPNDATLTLDYIELKSKGDIMRYHLPTVTNSELLESAGVYKLTATFNTEVLGLASSKSINVKTPATNPVNQMELFNLDTDFNFWTQLDGQDDQWDNVQIAEWPWQTADGTTILQLGYEFDLYSLNWTNCDVFVDIAAEDKTSFCVSMAEDFTNSNTILFAVYKNYNSVISLSNSEGTQQFCDVYSASPVGEAITLVGITAYEDDVFFLGTKELNIERDQIESLEMELKSYAEIEAYLSTL